MPLVYDEELVGVLRMLHFGIKSIDKKVDRIMATQQDLDNELTVIEADQAATNKQIAAVIADLQTKGQVSNVDLTPEINRLVAIHNAFVAEQTTLSSDDPTLISTGNAVTPGTDTGVTAATAAKVAGTNAPAAAPAEAADGTAKLAE